MRLVLQSNSTSLYYCWGDQWTPRFKEAHDFGSFNNVVEFLRESKLEGVELVLIHESIGRINFEQPCGRVSRNEITAGAKSRREKTAEQTAALDDAGARCPTPSNSRSFWS